MENYCYCCTHIVAEVNMFYNIHLHYSNGTVEKSIFYICPSCFIVHFGYSSNFTWIMTEQLEHKCYKCNKHQSQVKHKFITIQKDNFIGYSYAKYCEDCFNLTIGPIFDNPEILKIPQK